MEGARASLVKGKRVGGSSEGGINGGCAGGYGASDRAADRHGNRCCLDVA